MNGPVTIVGGGLAGSEAALALAARGHAVRLYEMRPATPTGAHHTGELAELVCSNSLGSRLPGRATAILMEEAGRLDSRLLDLARAHAVPAGGALAVNRERFAHAVTGAVASLINPSRIWLACSTIASRRPRESVLRCVAIVTGPS